VKKEKEHENMNCKVCS